MLARIHPIMSCTAEPLLKHSKLLHLQGKHSSDRQFHEVEL